MELHLAVGTCLQDRGIQAEPDCPLGSAVRAQSPSSHWSFRAESGLVTSMVLPGRDTPDLLQLEHLSFCQQSQPRASPCLRGCPALTKTPGAVTRGEHLQGNLETRPRAVGGDWKRRAASLGASLLACTATRQTVCSSHPAGSEHPPAHPGSPHSQTLHRGAFSTRYVKEAVVPLQPHVCHGPQAGREAAAALAQSPEARGCGALL